MLAAQLSLPFHCVIEFTPVFYSFKYKIKSIYNGRLPNSLRAKHLGVVFPIPRKALRYLICTCSIASCMKFFNPHISAPYNNMGFILISNTLKAVDLSIPSNLEKHIFIKVTICDPLPGIYLYY